MVVLDDPDHGARQMLEAKEIDRNLRTPVNQLDDREELVVRIPSETLELVATINDTAKSTDVLGR
jgi:hypothetical protein